MKAVLILCLTAISTSLAALGSLYFPEHRSPVIESIAVVLLSLPALYAVINSLGPKKGLFLLGLLYIFAIGIETVGIFTGFPYGNFEYRNFSVGIRFFDVTPWTVGFAWTPIVVGTFVLARQYVRSAGLLFAGVMLLLSYDLVLDPVAVHLGYWSFTDGGIYYNVPLQNFIGWLFSGSIGMVMILLLVGKLHIAPIAIVSLMLHLVFFSTKAVALGMYIPSIIGVLLLGACLKTIVSHRQQLLQTH